MELAETSEQEELRRTLRRWLAERSPMAEVRRLMEGPLGYHPGAWKQLGAELGLQGLAIPERFGGSGFGWAELMVVFEELGGALACAPFLSTVALAASALLTSGDEAAMASLLPDIASGTCVATAALTEAEGRPELGEVSTVASLAGGGWVLDGEKCFVLDGCAADIILVTALAGGGHAPAGGGLSLFAVRGDADGLERTALTTMDQTRRQARISLSATPARLVGVAGGAGPGLERTLQLAAVALAAEQVGGAQRCLDMTVAYAQARMQFGRPIGSFQAVKHRLAEMLVDVTQARSAAYAAGWVAASVGKQGWASVPDDLSDELAVVASVAKAFCSDVYFRAAESCIQVHGGIGFTWEHDAHLYFKRAKSSQLAFGDPTYHRELVASRLGL